MKLNIIAVGQKMPKWVNDAFSEYQKRMPKEMEILLKEVAVAPRKNNQNKEKLQAAEWKKQNALLPDKGIVVALDEKGKQWSTKEWATQLETWMLETNQVSFLLGGPDGLCNEAKSKANQFISLGKMTMPHGLARVVLVEQLYRAYSLYKGHPYHREG
ncbi:MAG: 23S rRNA (pseudouridine(1915)-N(3))-methyltransferase RlmH [Gammaproteobacteria bacterium]|nr:23S rRNA (pseudouridine(1915)-N(3))-methyltransferase RlmH [Gammaproteobacteria bacterium]